MGGTGEHNRAIAPSRKSVSVVSAVGATLLPNSRVDKLIIRQGITSDKCGAARSVRLALGISALTLADLERQEVSSNTRYRMTASPLPSTVEGTIDPTKEGIWSGTRAADSPSTATYCCQHH